MNAAGVMNIRWFYEQWEFQSFWIFTEIQNWFSFSFFVLRKKAIQHNHNGLGLNSILPFIYTMTSDDLLNFS